MEGEPQEESEDWVRACSVLGSYDWGWNGAASWLGPWVVACYGLEGGYYGGVVCVAGVSTAGGGGGREGEGSDEMREVGEPDTWLGKVTLIVFVSLGFV